jgi:hypothetical protein
VLDLGCALGYYSHRLAILGAIVDGIELKKERYGFCQYLSELYGLPKNNPQFYNVDITDYINENKTHYDFVLFLNTIHWVFRQHGEKTWEMLDKISLSCDRMYLSWGGHNFSPDECLEKTHFTTYKNLGYPKKKGRGRKREIYLYE